jgi:hypothetical protein
VNFNQLQGMFEPCVLREQALALGFDNSENVMEKTISEEI